jgi:hypothetical protein
MEDCWEWHWNYHKDVDDDLTTVAMKPYNASCHVANIEGPQSMVLTRDLIEVPDVVTLDYLYAYVTTVFDRIQSVGISLCLS